MILKFVRVQHYQFYMDIFTHIFSGVTSCAKLDEQTLQLFPEVNRTFTIHHTAFIDDETKQRRLLRKSTLGMFVKWILGDAYNDELFIKIRLATYTATLDGFEVEDSAWVNILKSVEGGLKGIYIRMVHTGSTAFIRQLRRYSQTDDIIDWHVKLAVYKEALSTERYNELFKFCVIREPISLLISGYMYKRDLVLDHNDPNIYQHVIKILELAELPLLKLDLCDPLEDMDMVIPYEELTNAMPIVAEKVGLKFTDLPKENVITNGKVSDETRAFIREILEKYPPVIKMQEEYDYYYDLYMKLYS